MATRGRKPKSRGKTAPPTIDIIRAIREEEIFHKFLNPRGDGLDSWAKWMAALRALYGLRMGRQSRAWVEQYTGRNPYKLPKEGFEKALFLVGRRGGKSQITSLIGAYEAVFGGHETKLAPGEEGLVACMAQTKENARKVYLHIDAIFSKDVSPLLATMVVERSKTDGILLNNGLRIKTQAADPRTVRGPTVVAAIVDEACHLGYQSDARVKSDTELMAALEPALASTMGKLICISSPYARRGWCYNEWKENYGVDGADILVWQAASLEMNNTLSKVWVDKRIAKDPAKGRAEYLALWRDDIVAFVSREMVEALVVGWREELPPENTKHGLAHKYLAFVDMSGGRGDAASLAVAHKDGVKVVQDYIEWWDAPHSPRDVIGQMATVLKRYGIRNVMGDNYGGEWPVEAFKGHGITYTPSPKPKSDLYLELLPIMTSGEIELLDCGRLHDELCGLERSTRSGGKDKVDHPQGAHDDVANALAGVATMCKPERVATATNAGASGPGDVWASRHRLAQMVHQQYQQANSFDDYVEPV